MLLHKTPNQCNHAKFCGDRFKNAEDIRTDGRHASTLDTLVWHVLMKKRYYDKFL